MVPLIVADVAFGSGHFNLAQGIVGTAVGIGASLSTVLAGYVSDKLGSSTAFMGLAGSPRWVVHNWLVMPRRGGRHEWRAQPRPYWPLPSRPRISAVLAVSAALQPFLLHAPSYMSDLLLERCPSSAFAAWINQSKIVIWY